MNLQTSQIASNIYGDEIQIRYSSFNGSELDRQFSPSDTT